LLSGCYGNLWKELEELIGGVFKVGYCKGNNENLVCS
jgi:hypothetical protein